ncbi:MAG: fasciclin domain-containing protein [Leptolyngbyaceae cyanobacterium bins.349]|nr:fasciclin domain-containing protein [Leptolyngbyaceae cyanobacterium bins.349]
MRIQLFALPLKQVTTLLAIAAMGSLSTLPAVAKSCPNAAKPAKSVTQPVNSNSSVVVPVVAETTGTKAKTTGTIVDIAASNAAFKTLVAAVKAAGLVEVLSSKGPFTVFAPTDAAFAALPKGTLESLLKPENKAKLQRILTYHVVPGSVLSGSIKPGQVKTVEGKSVTLSTMGNRVMVNNANVTSADIQASNGVIHVIDKVILPPDL